jgi:hypothetical protein
MQMSNSGSRELRGRTVTWQGLDSIGSRTSRSGHTSYVHPSGTGTTPATRAAVQVAPAPQSIAWSYRTSGGAHGAWEAPNPAPGGGAPWDAGHMLPRAGGGPGHVPALVVPQNPQVNRGTGGHYGEHRAHEREMTSDLRRAESARVAVTQWHGPRTHYGP